MSNLSEQESLVDQKSHNCAGNQDVREEKVVILLVVRVIIRGLELHHVNNSGSGRNENDLHDGVVQGQEVVEQVDITRQKDK